MTGMRRILVVDDDESNLDVLCEFLLSLEYHPVIAHSGAEALEKITENIDLILLDVMMPDMDGYRVASRIKKNPHFSDIPIIMVTILDAKGDRLNAVRSGANDFISKPIDRLELKVRMASLLKMKDAQDAVKHHLSELEKTVRRRTEAVEESERRYKELYRESKQRQELYRTLLESSPDAIAVLDRDFRVTYINPAFTSTFGWSGSELEGSILSFVPEQEKHTHRRVIREAIRTGVPFTNLETRRLTKEGRILDVSISGSRFLDRDGSPAGAVLTTRDVTERKMMETALKESEERFRAMFESAQDLIFVKDSNFTYTEVNPAMIEFMGIPREEILGKTDENLFDREHARRTRDFETRVLSGQIIETEYRIAYMARIVKLDVISIPMRGASGEVIGLCSIGRDVTEHSQRGLDPETDDGKYPSAAMQSTLAAARLGSGSDSTILLTGESGSGKDYLAQRIHKLSARSTGPYQTVNCAAIPHDLAESELFGYEAGAFTGATRRKRGLLELAEGGTLLLNEIGDLALPIQAKLLTFLDTRTITRVGGEKPVTLSVRLIAATNRDLEKGVVEGTFRQDLYYRLNVFSIKIPPLRDRTADIPILASELLRKVATSMQVSPVPAIHPEVIALFSQYAWPGNVRELRNVVERAMILSKGGLVLPAHVNLAAAKIDRLAIPPDLLGSTSLEKILGDFERTLIQEALTKSSGAIAPAARLLGITRYALARHMKKLGLSGR